MAKPTSSAPKKRKIKGQLEPTRRSTRETSSKKINYNFDNYDKELNAAERAFEGKSASMGYLEPNLDENLMTCEEYCERKGLKKGLKIEGDFELSLIHI